MRNYIIHNSLSPDAYGFDLLRSSLPLMAVRRKYKRVYFSFFLYQKFPASFYFTDPVDGYQIPLLGNPVIVKSYEDCQQKCYRSRQCKTFTFDSNSESMKCYTSGMFYPKESDLNKGNATMKTARLVYASLVREQSVVNAIETLKKMPIDFKIPIEIYGTVYEHPVVQPPYLTNTKDLDIPKYYGQVFTQLAEGFCFAGYSLVPDAHCFKECSRIALKLIDGRNVIGFTYSALDQICQLGYAPAMPATKRDENHFTCKLFFRMSSFETVDVKKLFHEDGSGGQYPRSVIEAFDHDMIEILEQKINSTYECAAKCLNSILFNCVAFFMNEKEQICILAATNKISANVTIAKGNGDVTLDLYTLQSNVVFPKYKVLGIDTRVLSLLTPFPIQTTNLAYECLGIGSKNNQTCHGYVSCYDGSYKFFAAGMITKYQDWITEAKKVTKSDYTCRVYKREFMRLIGIHIDEVRVELIQHGPSKGAVIGSSLGLFCLGFIIVGGVIFHRG
ncbi:hypothetical protein Ciccas_010148 [Cichlidogyrus casuarinus]|uniref:Apple domain-containing protein n=1 Tax=Cichlidogyrus casuarinus TaxID=1844966 RepID=A0ABD2PVI5_9PLAT